MKNIILFGLLSCLFTAIVLADHPPKRRTFNPHFNPQPTSIPVAFFDADSTLRITRTGRPTPKDKDDVRILPLVAEKIGQLNRSGYLVAVVSNQGDVASGKITFAEADAALATMLKGYTRLGVRFDYYDFAENKDEYRKPEIGMAKLLDRLLHEQFERKIDISRSFMVGDAGWKKDEIEPSGKKGSDFSNSDRLFAENLAIPYHHPRDYFGWKDYSVTYIYNDKKITHPIHIFTKSVYSAFCTAFPKLVPFKQEC